MQRRSLRYCLFITAVLVGFAAGIVLGWEFIPTQHVHSEPYALRIDYKTDFVLMASELYHQDGDLDMALTRLTYLEESPPSEKLQSAIRYAEENDYSSSDLQLMLNLYSSIQNPSSTEE